MTNQVLQDVPETQPATVEFASWLKDAKAHGPALQAAIDRYLKVYSEMDRAPVVYTCIDMRQGAMAAAIEVYASKVADQQASEVHAALGAESPTPAPAAKAFLVAASYHFAMQKDYMVEAARLELAHKMHGDEESLELSKVALDHAKSHSGSASDMMRMAMGEKPEHIDDAFGEFDKTRARILR